VVKLGQKVENRMTLYATIPISGLIDGQMGKEQLTMTTQLGSLPTALKRLTVKDFYRLVPDGQKADLKEATQ
jgi:hypothetical protein